MEIGKEYEKYMKFNPSKGLRELKFNGFLEKYIPELDELENCKLNSSNHTQPNVLDHVIYALEPAFNQSMRRINSVTLHDIGKLITRKGTKYPKHDIKGVPIAEEILIDLKRPDEEIDCVLFCVENHMKIHDIMEMKPLKRLKIYENPYFDDLCFVYQADTYGKLKECKINEILKDKNFLVENETNPLLNENEIRKYGITGNEINVVMNDLIQKQIAGTLKNKWDALRFIQNKYVKWDIVKSNPFCTI